MVRRDKILRADISLHEELLELSKMMEDAGLPSSIMDSSRLAAKKLEQLRKQKRSLDLSLT